MKELIDTGNLPKHIAVIMDGNGRWAQNQGAARVFGHRNAIKAVREVTEGCAELGVSCLTLYAFSTENWARPEFEVRALMELLVQSIGNELPTMMKNNVRLDTIGDTVSLPRSCQNQLGKAIEATRNNTGLNLILALGYSGKWDITQAVRKIAEDVQAVTTGSATSCFGNWHIPNCIFMRIFSGPTSAGSICTRRYFRIRTAKDASVKRVNKLKRMVLSRII
jgi:undecaprenyl diphosphate synthase